MNEQELGSLTQAVGRVALILGAIYASHLGDVDQRTKAERLSRCGFSNREIADLLGTSTNAINVAIHRARKGVKATAKSRG